MTNVYHRRRHGVAATVLAVIAVILPQVSLLAQSNVAPGPTMRFPIFVPLILNRAAPAPSDRQAGVPSAALAVRQALAQKLGIEANDIDVLKAEHVDWPNSCLGAPFDAAPPVSTMEVVCTTAITPGYRIVLETCGDRYVYHTNEDGSDFRLAEEPEGVVGKVLIVYTDAGLCSSMVGIDEIASAPAHFGLDRFGQGSPSHTTMVEGLTGAKWCATRYDNGAAGSQNVLTGTALTVRFDTDGHLKGFAGCNRYWGAYTADGTALAIDGLVSTRAICAADVMLQEQAYLAALQRAARYRVCSGSLFLFGQSDDELSPSVD